MQKGSALAFGCPNKSELLSLSDFISKKRLEILRQPNVWKTNRADLHLHWVQCQKLTQLSRCCLCHHKDLMQGNFQSHCFHHHLH